MTSPAAQEPTAKRIESADKEPQNWLTYGGNYNFWCYSALDQINRDNIRNLAPAWAFSTGELRGGLNSTPLVMDGVMYLVGPMNRVFAINAATGEKLWSYYYKLPDRPVPYTSGTRGIALGYGLVYLGTLDNHLVAIDAKTGREVWDVEVQDTRQCGCNITSAPLVVKDKVIVGGTGGETAHRGYLTAFDARTGKFAWRFYTIPGPGEPGFETWSKESWKYGGAPTWLTGSYDPELNLVYWGVGNPSSDFYGDEREGDNLYTDSIIALDADTGKLKWHFQEVPHDLYDFDSSYECVLVDVERGGRKQKLLLHANKGGYSWVLDRTNGKFVSAYPHVDILTWMKGVDANGRPVDRQHVDPKGGTFVCPAIIGGRNWEHSTWSPRTGLWYNPAWEVCNIINPVKMEAREGQGFFGGGVAIKPPKDRAPYGHIDAVDPVTGERKWRYMTKYLNLSSLLSTGGDLIFAGDVEGNAFALDARTGEQLWSFRMGGGVSGSPISYAVNGRQYVAIPSGMGSLLAGVIPELWPEMKGREPERASTLFVFALPGTAGSKQATSNGK
ncbi:MAG TPA: PQQ-dependent dehydrogenase, methanol/ethanol family [Blastocatellia bacterium]|nr:PQQ-dependent dehydrogenase, methanol/ethanol family [Blastocatellia bacterium]